MHPSEALFQDSQPLAVLPLCDHYAGSEKLMRKSLRLQQEMGPLFDITLDCEDGAAVGAEITHAQMIGELAAGDENRFNRVGVRLQHVDHATFLQSLEIICALSAHKLAYIMLPKLSGYEALLTAIKKVNLCAATTGRNQIPIHVLIETPSALADVLKIASHPQVESLSFGIMDFISSHHGAIPASAMSSPQQFVHPLVARAKLEISAACHACGKVASHNVTTKINDDALVASDAKLAASQFGFQRMWSIHPSQIKPILAGFAPAESEITHATEILTAAQINHWAPIQHNGTLHDRASYRYYWTILQRAKAVGAMVTPAIADLL